MSQSVPAVKAAALLNYTTSVPADRTVGEVQSLLARHGAAAVAVHYDEQGLPTGLTFVLRTPHGERTFLLPVDVTGVQAALVTMERAGRFRASRKAAGTYTSPEHAHRVAWRVVKDWLEATLALVQANLARLDQVMLPYLQVEPGKALYQAYSEREEALALPGA